MILETEVGQSMVETVIVMFGVMTLLGFFLSYAHFAGTQIWIDHVLNDALYCMEQKEASSRCVAKYSRQITENIPMIEIISFELSRTSRRLTAEIQFRLLNLLYLHNFHLKKQSEVVPVAQ